ncbi:MAG TPA: BatD family protein [Candidatus Dormibacteraeota bacterium]|nr:BatD family protein [Candidatus Dormibacteraeota bacterium]
MNVWIRRQRIILLPIVALLLCLALGYGAEARAATFTASLDRDTIAIGENATLSLTFEGGPPQNTPVPPNIPGLQISYVGPSSQFSFINGQTSSTVTHHFILTARQTGEFIIPSLVANVDGHQLTSQPVKLTVTQPETPTTADVDSGSQVAFMKLELPKKKFYPGEVVTAQLRVYLRDDVQNFGNFQFTAMPADGFTVGKMAQGSAQRAQIGGHTYSVIPLAIALTVIKTGTLSIGPVTASAVIVLPASGRSRDTVFEQFGIRDPFDNFGGERKQVSLVTDPLNAESLPLPAENVPASFNGAVGDYTMTVTAGPTNITVGDPITVRVQISGHGALDSLTLPDQTAWQNFKTYPPTSKVETTDQLGLEGTKTFEEIVTPQNTDLHELPPFSFSFFDPEQNTYRTLTQPSMRLIVHSGGAVAVPVIAATKTSGTENPQQQDILPIKEQLGTLEKISPPLAARPAFVALQSLPVFAWLAAFVWRKRTENLANNPRLRRHRHVLKLIQNGTNDLRRFTAENNSDKFFAALFRLLQEQLGERLDCPASAITEAVIDEHPVFRNAPEATLHALRELFQLCNQARYAPMRTSGELAAVIPQFENAIRELQNLKT